MKRIGVLTTLFLLAGLPAFSQSQDSAYGGRGYRSDIFENNGMVGIGTRNPLGLLNIVGDSHLPDRANQFVISSRVNPNLKLYFGIRNDMNPPAAQISLVEEGVAWRNLGLAINGGNVGIGILTPTEKLDVMGNMNVGGVIMGKTAVFDSAYRLNDPNNYRDARDYHGYDRDRRPGPDSRDNVILALGWNHTRVFRVAADGSVFARTFNTGGMDYAESVEVTGKRTQYTPGDVMAIDKDSPDGFTLAQQPYSTLVAGVYSTKPGVLASTHPLEAERFEAEVPLAMFGIVPCKVTAENGPIARGDLLVSSSRPGYAMKGTDKQRMLGAIVGKALDPLPQGTGTIRVMLSSR
jgi:hypothetical protein